MSFSCSGPYLDGFNAFLSGFSIHYNPYRNRSYEFSKEDDLWIKGYMDSKNKSLKNRNPKLDIDIYKNISPSNSSLPENSLKFSISDPYASGKDAFIKGFSFFYNPYRNIESKGCAHSLLWEQGYLNSKNILNLS